MTLRPDTLAMTAVLAMLTALGPLSTDFYLPSLPEIARVMQSDLAGAQAQRDGIDRGAGAAGVLDGELAQLEVHGWHSRCIQFSFT